MNPRSCLAVSAAFAACLAVPLAGCTARYRSESVQAGGSARLDVSTGSRLGAAIIVGVVAADGFRYYAIGPDGSKTPVGAPDPDPTRRINIQDCTQPVDPAAGNLLCR
jgi:hypothetical protein